MAQIDQDWLKHTGEQSDRECPADDHDREGPLGLCSDPRRQRRRQESEGIDEIGHHGRTKPPVGTHDDGFDERVSLVPELMDICAQHDAVNHSDAEDRDEANCC
jgi:hypothetical protein